MFYVSVTDLVAKQIHPLSFDFETEDWPSDDPNFTGVFDRMFDSPSGRVFYIEMAEMAETLTDEEDYQYSLNQDTAMALFAGYSRGAEKLRVIHWQERVPKPGLAAFFVYVIPAEVPGPAIRAWEDWEFQLNKS